jgi:hypothetical protein
VKRIPQMGYANPGPSTLPDLGASAHTGAMRPTQRPTEMEP